MTPDFQPRFDNWIRWAQQKNSNNRRTQSLEGQYRSPQHWHPAAPQPLPFNTLDAITINRAFTHLRIFSPRYARIIKILAFHPHLRPQWQAQKLGIHYLVLDQAFHRAKLALSHRVDILESRAYNATRRPTIALAI